MNRFSLSKVVIGLVVASLLVLVSLTISSHDHATKRKLATSPSASISPSSTGPVDQSSSSQTDGTTAVPTPTGSTSSQPATTDALTKQVMQFLSDYYRLDYTDTQAKRLQRMEGDQPSIPPWVYSQLDLSVGTVSPYDLQRIHNRFNRVGLVQTSQIQLRKVTATDYYVSAPVFATYDNGQTGTFFQTGSTWLYKNHSWVINSFGDGSDS